MRFQKVIPCDKLKPYVKHFAISENSEARTYKVFPTTGLVIGFQYKGNLAVVDGDAESKLSGAGISGISDRYRVFKSSPDIGTILVYFKEAAIAQFASLPAHELFGQSVSIDNLFKPSEVTRVEEELSSRNTDSERITTVESFLLRQLKAGIEDKMVNEAVKIINASDGTVRINSIHEQLYTSQSAFEKRFRKQVGTSPKKFASIVRFNKVLHALNSNAPLIDICYRYNYFDQAHFIHDFKQFTGDSPEQFRRFL